MDKANINEPLQERKIREIDLPEATRRNDAFKDLNEVIDKLQTMSVFPSLVWTWAFSIMRDIFDNCQYDDLTVNDYVDEAVPSGITLKQIFDKFWEDVDNLGIDMDLGGEIIEETIRDWMRENDFLVALDEDGWLND